MDIIIILAIMPAVALLIALLNEWCYAEALLDEIERQDGELSRLRVLESRIREALGLPDDEAL